ncbi:MAG TPA: hypothetical protein VLN73_01335, partial [Alphaproteobacteria bacterium]|nr:hypothetical protein [Alphaproteobacteria bacterium]
MATLDFRLRADARKALGELRKFQRGITGVGKSAKRAGRQGSKGLKPVSSGLNAVASKAAAAAAAFVGFQQARRIVSQLSREINNFNRGFAEVSTLVDTAAVDLGKMRSDLLALGGSAGTAEDRVRALYQALSASVDPARS